MCPLDLFSFIVVLFPDTHTTLTHAAHNAAGKNSSGRHFSVHSISSRLAFVSARCLVTRGRGVSLLVIRLSSSVVCVVDLIGHYRDVINQFITEAKRQLLFALLRLLGVLVICVARVCVICAAHYKYRFGQHSTTTTCSHTGNHTSSNIALQMQPLDGTNILRPL